MTDEKPDPTEDTDAELGEGEAPAEDIVTTIDDLPAAPAEDAEADLTDAPVTIIAHEGDEPDPDRPAEG